MRRRHRSRTVIANYYRKITSQYTVLAISKNNMRMQENGKVAVLCGQVFKLVISSYYVSWNFSYINALYKSAVYIKFQIII